MLDCFIILLGFLLVCSTLLSLLESDEEESESDDEDGEEDDEELIDMPSVSLVQSYTTGSFDDVDRITKFSLESREESSVVVIGLNIVVGAGFGKECKSFDDLADPLPLLIGTTLNDERGKLHFSRVVVVVLVVIGFSFFTSIKISTTGC